MSFKVGDRVEYVGGLDRVRKGYKGTIVHVWGEVNPIVNVDWDKHIDGHSCENLARKGHGWNVYASEVRLVQPDVNLNPADLKYANVIRKSKQLNARFENRKKGIDYVVAA